MLVKSPSFQRLLFENLVEGTLAAQTGNPTVALERMAKGAETEYGRRQWRFAFTRSVRRE